MYGIMVFENLRFRPSTRKRVAIIFTLESVFEKTRFR